jgi:hypothetical protein
MLDAFGIETGLSVGSEVSDRVGEALEIYRSLGEGLVIEEAPHLQSLVRAADTRTPIQRWFQYREGYTLELCHRVFAKNEQFVVDPFCGFGSTLLAAKMRNIPSIGIDVNPLAAFVSRVKTRGYSKRNISMIEQEIVRIRSSRLSSVCTKTPSLRIIHQLFHPEILEALLFFRALIEESANVVVRDFLIMGWLSILEGVSNVYREGNGVKYRNRRRRGNIYTTIPYHRWQKDHFPENKFRYVREELSDQLALMAEDVKTVASNCVEPIVIHGDATDIVSVVPKGGASLALFSPPYCNCFNYIKAYKLELWMAGFIECYSDIRKLTSMGIRSRLESLLEPVSDTYPPVVNSLVELMDAENLWSPQLPELVKGYFADMQRCLESIHTILAPGGRCVIVVGNSAYAGILVPSDLLLASTAQTIGFEVDKIAVARHLTTSSQQRKRVWAAKELMRESVIYLRRTKN